MGLFYLHSLKIQAIMVEKAHIPRRPDAETVASYFGRIIDYDPGVSYHHFTLRSASTFKKIRTFTPRKVRGVKIKYGPLRK